MSSIASPRITAFGLMLAAPFLIGAADPVKSRIEVYRELGASFKNVNDELRKPTPQTYLIQLAARQIGQTAKAQYGFFPAGSGPQTGGKAPGVKTYAKAEIWSQPARFKAAQDAFAVQAASFAKVAAGGDPARLRVAAKALGQSCSGCHKVYRTEKK